MATKIETNMKSELADNILIQTSENIKKEVEEYATNIMRAEEQSCIDFYDGLISKPCQVQCPFCQSI